MSAPTAVVLLAAVSLAVGMTGAGAARPPVLGSPHYLGESPYGKGFGQVRPHTIFNGGAPSGLVSHIKWRKWGRRTAPARGRGAIYRPQGGYFPPVQVVLQVRRLGSCAGESGRAYRQLRVRVPQWPRGPLGPWFKWSGSTTMCDYSVRGSGKARGYCGYLGDDYDFAPGEVFSIQAYRLSCRTARRAARKLGHPYPKNRCFRKGCMRRIGGLTCRLERIHSGELTPDFDDPLPVERVSCRRGARHMTGWLAVAYD